MQADTGQSRHRHDHINQHAAELGRYAREVGARPEWRYDPAHMPRRSAPAISSPFHGLDLDATKRPSVNLLLATDDVPPKHEIVGNWRSINAPARSPS